MRSRIVISCVVLLFISAFPLSAQQLRLTLDGGISKPAGNQWDQYAWGYTFGAGFMFRVTEHVQLGTRVGFNRWGADEADFLDRIDPFDIIDPEIQGEATALEVLPLVRLSTASPMSPLNFFIHGAAGLYVFNTQIEVNGVDEENNLIQEVFGEDLQLRFGFQTGAGVIIGNPDYLSIEIYPTYNLVFNVDGNRFQYFTINLGIGLGI